MKKLLLATALAALSSPVLAGGYDWGNTATASAGAGGTVGAFMDSYKGDVDTWSEANTLTRADTRPTYGAAVAGLGQEAAGYGKDRHFLEGGFEMMGGTDVYAKVGKKGVGADTSTYGNGYVIGGAYGDDHSVVYGDFYGSSEQGSVAVDTPYGGSSDGEAQQLSVANVGGHASGDHEASVSVGASTTSVATAND